MAQNPFIIEAPDIGERYMQGLQIGRNMALQDQQLRDVVSQREAQAAMMQDIAAVSSNPSATAQDYVGLMMRNPSMAENIKSSLSTLNDAQQKSAMTDMSQIFAASNSGRNDIAKSLLQNLHDAAVESGDERQALTYQTMLAGADADPNYLRNTSGIAMSAIYGDKFADMFPKIQEAQQKQDLHPSEIIKSAGEAKKSYVEGEQAEEKGATDIEAKREETKSRVLQRDIDKIKLKLDSEKNETERLKLQAEIEEKQAKLGKSSVVAQNSLDTAQDGISALDRIMGDPDFSKAVGTGGDLTSYFNSAGGRNIRSQLKTLSAQQAMANVNKARENGGLGPLSDADMKLYASAVANLETDQSAENLATNLQTIRGVLERNRQDIIASGNLKTEGGRFIGKNASGNQVTEGMVNKYMISAPDVPREKIVKFLMSK